LVLTSVYILLKFISHSITFVLIIDLVELEDFISK
jgi:hypothetical protein